MFSIYRILPFVRGEKVSQLQVFSFEFIPWIIFTAAMKWIRVTARPIGKDKSHYTIASCV